MKEMKFEIPAGCEVDKIETQDGHIVVTFREKERKLPNSFDKFCNKFPIQRGECYISNASKILCFPSRKTRDAIFDANTLPDRATAEAVLALCQLIQLRNCYNGDWVPDWEDDDEDKHVIYFYKSNCGQSFYQNTVVSPLYFKTKELRDEFLRNFRPLIERLNPLYGIKEGGEEC